MSRFPPFPLTLPIILSAAFAAGCAAALALASAAVFIPALIAVIVLASSAFLVRRKSYAAVILSAAFIAAGAAYTTGRYYQEFRSPLIDHCRGAEYFEATVRQYEGLNLTRHSHLAMVHRVILSNGTAADAYGTIRLYANTEKAFIAGDRLLIKRPIRVYRDMFAATNRVIGDILERRRIIGVTSLYRRSDYLMLARGSGIAAFAQRAAFSARAFVKRALGTYTSGQVYAVAQCFILGDKSPLSPDVIADFQRAGTMHILSVSGLHFSMVIAIIVLIAGFLPVNSFVRVGIAVVLTVVLYSPLTLYVPPVMRSGVMAILLLVIMLFDRTRNLPNALMLTLFILLLISPKDLADISLELSFIATLSLVLFLQPLDSIIRAASSLARLPIVRYLTTAALTSVSAVVFTAPLTASYFDTINFTSILSNMIAVPLSFIMLSLSFLIVATSPLPVIPVWYGAALTGVTKLFLAINAFFAGIPLRIDGIRLPFAYAAGISALLVIIGFGVSVWLNRKAGRIAEIDGV